MYNDLPALAQTIINLCASLGLIATWCSVRCTLAILKSHSDRIEKLEKQNVEHSSQPNP